ncbi:MAG: tetratricopeptide repeat protein [Acidobacteriota bacterium]
MYRRSLRFRRIASLALLLAGVVEIGGSAVAEATPPRVAQARAIVRGKLVDQDGRPLAGVGVIIELYDTHSRLLLSDTVEQDRKTISEVGQRHAKFDVVTDEQGAFSYPGLVANVEYRVRFEKEGYVPVEHKMVFRVAVNEIGTIALLSGNVEAARGAYRKGYEAYEAGRYQAAAAAMDEVVAVFGDSDSSDQMLTVALGVLGQSRLRLRQLPEAEAALQRLVAIEPESVTAHSGLGNLRASQGDFARAAAHFGRSVELQPENPNHHFNLGSVLLLTGNLEEAINALEKCVELQPAFPQAHKALGQAYGRTGERQKAIEHLKEYLDQAPGAADADEVRAMIDKLQGNVGLKDSGPPAIIGGFSGWSRSSLRSCRCPCRPWRARRSRADAGQG